MSWQDKAKKIARGRWIKFDQAMPEHVLYFSTEPEEVEKTVQTGDRKGEKFRQMSFPVNEDGEKRILEPNRSLLAQLIEEDSIKPIIGRTLKIKCLDLKGMRNWSIRAADTQEEVTRIWNGEQKEGKRKKVGAESRDSASESAQKLTGEPLRKRVMAHLEGKKSAIPFKVANKVNAEKLGEVIEIFEELGWEETEEMDQREKMPIWKPEVEKKEE